MIHDVYPKAAALAEDESLARAVSELIPKVHEFSTFLVHKLGLEDVGAHSRTASLSTRPATRSGSSGLATRPNGFVQGAGNRPGGTAACG